MTREEIEFRERLRAFLMGAWIPTWHEPTIGSSVGTPDCSFVMKSSKLLTSGIIHMPYETGWAELKATKTGRGGKLVVKIEPSQHQWMYNHAKLIPCVFLIEVDRSEIYMIDGVRSQEIATDSFYWPRLARNQEPYKYATCRDRLIADLQTITKRHL